MRRKSIWFEVGRAPLLVSIPSLSYAHLDNADGISPFPLTKANDRWRVTTSSVSRRGWNAKPFLNRLDLEGDESRVQPT